MLYKMLFYVTLYNMLCLSYVIEHVPFMSCYITCYVCYITRYVYVMLYNILFLCYITSYVVLCFCYVIFVI